MLVRRDGVTALMLAANKGQSEVVEYLITQGAKVNYKRKDGKTALDIAHPSTKEILKHPFIPELLRLAQDPNPAVSNRAKELVEAKKEVKSWLERKLWSRKVESFLANVQKGKYKH